MHTDLNYYVPTKLDDAGKFLIFDQSVAFFALVLFLIGYWINHPFIGLVVGVCVAYYFNKIKAGYHQGYVIHILYWISDSPKMKGLPSSSHRYFFG